MGHLPYCHDPPDYFRHNLRESHGMQAQHYSQITYWFSLSGMNCTKTFTPGVKITLGDFPLSLSNRMFYINRLSLLN